MKIISKPDIANWKYLFDCYQCRSKLEAEPSDVTYYEERHYNSDSDIDDVGYLVGAYCVFCAVCKSKRGLHSNDLPHLLKEQVKEEFLATKYKKGT